MAHNQTYRTVLPVYDDYDDILKMLERNKEDTSGDEDEDIFEIPAWTNKRPELWGKIETNNWLLWAGMRLGQRYHQMSPDLAIPGKELVLLSKEEFLRRDPLFGGKLFDLLKLQNALGSSDCQNDSTDAIRMDSLKVRTDDETSFQRRKPYSFALPKIFLFITGLLCGPEADRSIIYWMDWQQKIFKIKDTKKLAELWGKIKNNPSMEFDKLSRSVRYHYRTGQKKNTGPELFVKHESKTVYGIGTDAPPLETMYPNFKYDSRYCEGL